ncbi:inversin-A-like isoform X2 [Acanthaster planci]|uniref:Inversin-A-like isoform X2 n=1 Tax=Acanthaster planci TaxID=133434 RepID=A0A8B7XQR9_ACAPL|nr:inversin-A-like isoform X2 [Acanthaster planci]
MSKEEEEFLRLARSGNPDSLEAFLGNRGQKIDPNCSSKDGATPLIQCVQGSGRAAAPIPTGARHPHRRMDHLSCCRLLLRYRANPDSRDNLGRTALHWAVFYKKVDFVEALIDHKADPALRDDKGQNVLHFAVRVNADTCLQLLCTRVSPEVLEQRDMEGTPLLVYAAQLGHAHAVKILLGYGAKADASNRNKQTAAHIAAWGERTDILRLLFRHGAKPYTADVNNITVISAGSAGRNPEILRLILEKGQVEPEYLDIADVDGSTPLMIACRKGSTQVVEMLIDCGASLDVTDKSGKTAVHHAIEHRHNDCVRTLIETDPSLAALTDTEGRNALHLATIEGDMELIQLVLPHVDVNALDKEKHSALHWATVCGLYNVIALLIESGCNPATPDAHGAYPIHYATQMCSGDPSTAATGLRCLQALLRKGGSSVNCTDTGGKTPLLWAASSGNVRACRLLVDLRADKTMADDNGLTALHCATCRNHPICLESLLRDCRCDPNPVDKQGCTPLFYAITMEHVECARTLLKYGASPNWQDQCGKSPAFCAAARGSLPLLKLLHDYRASLSLRTTSKDTPLTHSADAGHIESMSFLLEHGCSVETRDGARRTSLHLAALKNNLLLCKLLVHHKANTNAVFKEKQKPITPLDCAEEKSSTECMDYLLSLGAKHGADIPEELWQMEEEEAGDQDPRRDDRDESRKEMDKKPDGTDDERGWGTSAGEKQGGKQPKSQEQNSEAIHTSEQSTHDPTEGQQPSQESTSDVDIMTDSALLNPITDNTDKEALERLSRNSDGRVDTEELKKKLFNWNAYLQDNVEFLDVVINSKAPELSEARRQARNQKKELVSRLEELKAEFERSSRLLVKDVERKEENRKERSLTDGSMIRSLHDIEERFQRANASAAASLDEFLQSQSKSPRRQDSWDQHGDKSYEEVPSEDGTGKERYDSRKLRHQAWLHKKNQDYINKKKSLQAATVITLAPSYTTGSNHDRGGTVVIPTRRSHSIPDHRTVKSPYNAKVILPLRLQEPRRRRSNESQLSGHEQAEIRRRMGELNNALLYPRASQMRPRQSEDAYNAKGSGARR